MDTGQLKGDRQSLCVSTVAFLVHANSRSSIDGGNCKPITSIDGKPVYPCGLIANSVFNGPPCKFCPGPVLLMIRHVPIGDSIESAECVEH